MRLDAGLDTGGMLLAAVCRSGRDAAAPGLYSSTTPLLPRKKLIVQKMRVAGAGSGEPGVVEVRGDAFLVGCGGGSLIALDEVQLEGKRRMSAAEFLRGNQVKSGERLGL